MHYHSCPNCYEHVSCQMSCSIEPDLQDDDKDFGTHCICDECQTFNLSQEWFDRYNGIKNVGR